MFDRRANTRVERYGLIVFCWEFKIFYRIMEKIIFEIKEQVAIEWGAKLKLPTFWNYAMLITSRKKEQLDLYEEVIRRVYLLNVETNSG